MTFHTDVSVITISTLHGAEAAAVMASCLDADEDVTLDDDTMDDATTVFDRSRGAKREGARAGVVS